MIYGTAHDDLNGHGSGLGVLPMRAIARAARPLFLQWVFRPRRQNLSGLSAYTGTPWMLDTSSGKLVSGLYGSVGNFGSNQTVASQILSSDGNFSYVTLRNTTDQSTTALTIALQPKTTVQKGGAKTTTYSPVIQSSTYTPPPYMPEPAPVTVVTTAVIGKGTSVAIDAPVESAPTFPNFPSLDFGFSYMLAPGETKFNAPGGDTTLFTNNAAAVGINVPSISGTPPGISIGAGGFSPIPISPSEQYDRWEYKLEQIPGPNNDNIFYRMTYRNLSKGSDYQTFDFSLSSGGGALAASIAIAAPTILRVVTDLSTGGAGEIVHAVDESDAQNVDRIVGASSIAAGAAVAVAFTGGAALPVVLAVGAIAAGAGTAIGATSKDDAAIVEYSLAAGAVIGTGGLVYSSIAASGGADAIGAAVNGEAATGGISSTVSAAPAVVPEAAAASAATPLIPASVTTAATTAVTGAAKAIGISALTTEIKKLTGQLPGVKAPSQAPSLTISGVQTPTGNTASGSSSQVIAWGLGLLATVAVLKKKIS